MKNNIRWGFLGCGEVTEQKSGPAFYKTQGSTVTAVMSRSLEKARDFANRHGVDRYYDNAEDLIQDDAVDAVYIATPPASHLTLALATAEAGKPAYIEKPMARSYSECLTICQAFEEKDLPLYVAYYRRSLPKLKIIHDLLNQNKIGSVRSFEISLHKPLPKKSDEALPWRLKPEIAGGGLFVDLACHSIDLVAYLLGSIEAVNGMATNQSRISEAEDLVCAQFRLENGVLGTGQWCFTTNKRTDSIVITGAEGRITFSNHGTEAIQLEDGHGIQLYNYETPDNIEQPFIEDVIKGIKGYNHFTGNVQQSAKVNWVMDEILNDYYNRK